eukprot:g1119.t1
MAMMQDLGSRDARFLSVVEEIRDGLLDMAGVSEDAGYECVLMQGSGTFAVESTVGSVVPRDGKLLILSNGAYGQRIKKMAEIYDIDHAIKQYAEREVPRVDDMLALLTEHPDTTHLAVIHHETTTGALNPMGDIGRALKEVRPDVEFIVDSMSGFGAYPVDMVKDNVSFLVSSSNKCVEGVPGFAYCLARRDALEAAEAGGPRSLALDLVGQWRGLQANRQFRFTPPTHAMLAFHQALMEHQAEGGWQGRLARYESNFEVLKGRMAEMGFHPYLDEDSQGCIITTFLFPEDPNFDFDKFYHALSDLGVVIYPGKLTEADCFRIGSIGRLFPRDMHFMVNAVQQVLLEMGVQLPVTQKSA